MQVNAFSSGLSTGNTSFSVGGTSLVKDGFGSLG
jgi:hypothetical protein